jgi:putative tryptophan/tyrosine transport system substrate-binding protein
MKRRQFLGLLGGAALTGPLGAHAQGSKLPVIGFLNPASARGLAQQLAAFHQGLKDAGYVNGRNVKIEYRWADGQYERLPELASDLVNRNVRLIAATGGSFPLRAAKKATENNPIPLLFVSGLDPLNEHVKSLQHPDTNVTGVSIQTTSPVLLEKRVRLLRAVVPSAATIAILTNRNNVESTEFTADMNAAEVAARAVRVAVIGQAAATGTHASGACAMFCPVHARSDSDLEMVFASLREKDNAVVVVGADPYFTDRRAQIVALAAKNRIPAIYPWREYVDAGGLMSYGSSLSNAYRLVGRFAGKILAGAKPEGLPVAQEGTFELAINLRAARALNLTVPKELLASKDYLIR